MNIQENKNQFDGKSLPKNFTRLVKALKKRKSHMIQEYFTTVLKSVEPKIEESRSEPVAEVYVVQEEEEEEQEEEVAESADEETPPPSTVQTTLDDAFGDFVQAAPSGKALKRQLALLMAALHDTTIYDSAEHIGLSKTLAAMLV